MKYTIYHPQHGFYLGSFMGRYPLWSKDDFHQFFEVPCGTKDWMKKILPTLPEKESYECELRGVNSEKDLISPIELQEQGYENDIKILWRNFMTFVQPHGIA